MICEVFRGGLNDLITPAAHETGHTQSFDQVLALIPGFIFSFMTNGEIIPKRQSTGTTGNTKR